MSKTQIPSGSLYSSWMNWIKGTAKRQPAIESAHHIHTEEFSDHMLRDVGILDGRHSKGYRRRRTIDGLLDKKFTGRL